MKNKFTLALAAIVLFLSLPLQAQKQDKNKTLETVRFETNIECDNCVSTIMKNIPFEKGVRDVRCDLGTKEVTIQYQKDKTRPELLKRALEKLGYTAKQKNSVDKNK